MRDNGYARAQAAYERQLPPEFYEPEYGEDCDDGKCGECRPCMQEAAAYAAECKAEAEYERRRELRYT